MSELIDPIKLDKRTLFTAIRAGNLPHIQGMVNAGKDTEDTEGVNYHLDHSRNIIFRLLCFYGSLEMMKFFLNEFRARSERTYPEILLAASQMKYSEWICELIKVFPRSRNIGFGLAVKNNRLDIAQFIVEYFGLEPADIANGRALYRETYVEGHTNAAKWLADWLKLSGAEMIVA
jgi:hypothetical protein